LGDDEVADAAAEDEDNEDEAPTPTFRYGAVVIPVVVAANVLFVVSSSSIGATCPNSSRNDSGFSRMWESSEEESAEWMMKR